MIGEILRSIVINGKNKRNKSFIAKPFLKPVSREFRVGLKDIDFNMHINNANYLRFMERARWDHPVQTNSWDAMLKNKLNFIVAGTEIGYIREIKFMKKFSVETNYLGWDEKYFYLEQRFVSDGKLHAYGLIKAVFLQKGKVADPEYIAGLLGVPSKSSALPEHMNLWKQMAIAKREYTA